MSEAAAARQLRRWSRRDPMSRAPGPTRGEVAEARRGHSGGARGQSLGARAVGKRACACGVKIKKPFKVPPSEHGTGAHWHYRKRKGGCPWPHSSAGSRVESMEIDVPANVVRVRLLLTVSRTGVRTGSRPSANIDCDECVYCRDKPRLGGPGTKRQKCVLKRSPTAHVRLQVHAYPTTHDGFSAAPP